MSRHFLSALAIAYLTASAAQAQSMSGEDTSFGISAGASTLGFTLEPSMRINDRWGMRAPFGMGSISLDDESNGQEYSGDLDLGGLGILADYYPFRSSGFRISAGAFYTDYSADISSDAVEFVGVTSEVTARIRQRKDIAPAIAVGYDGRLGRNATISFTLGGLFGDGFDVSASESSGLVPQELVDAEVDDIRDDLSDYDVIPYIQIAVGFRF